LRRLYFEALFIRNIYNDFITYTYILETLGITFPVINIGDFIAIMTSFFFRNKCPSVCLVLAANEIRSNVSMFDNHFFNISLQINFFNKGCSILLHSIIVNLCFSSTVL
jgi:hypothetical protein